MDNNSSSMDGEYAATLASARRHQQQQHDALVKKARVLTSDSSDKKPLPVASTAMTVIKRRNILGSIDPAASTSSSGSEFEMELVTSSNSNKGKKQQQTRLVSKAKKLSTERSRLCRQRQKNYAENLEGAVRSLQLEIEDLRLLHNLRREQVFITRSSASGSLARIIREYCDVFQFGMAPEWSSAASVVMTASKKRPLALTAASNQLTPQAQREFMTSVMDPQVQVFDWCGRSCFGSQPLLTGWEAWPLWHLDFEYQLEDVEVIDTAEMLAVRTKCRIRGTVSEKTIAQLFPYAAKNEALRRKLLGKEIVYPLRDTYFFSDERRVVKYIVDIDFIGALLEVVGNFADVLQLITPPNETPLNDLAIRAATAPGASVSNSPSRSRLDVQFLLS